MSPAMYSAFALLVSYLVASASALSSPPAGAITVGNGGKYATLSAALQDTSSLVCHYYSCAAAADCRPPLYAVGVLHLLRNVYRHCHHNPGKRACLRADQYNQLLHRKQYVLIVCSPTRPWANV